MASFEQVHDGGGADGDEFATDAGVPEAEDGDGDSGGDDDDVRGGDVGGASNPSPPPLHALPESIDQATSSRTWGVNRSSDGKIYWYRYDPYERAHAPPLPEHWSTLYYQDALTGLAFPWYLDRRTGAKVWSLPPRDDADDADANPSEAAHHHGRAAESVAASAGGGWSAGAPGRTAGSGKKGGAGKGSGSGKPPGAPKGASGSVTTATAGDSGKNGSGTAVSSNPPTSSLRRSLSSATSTTPPRSRSNSVARPAAGEPSSSSSGSSGGSSSSGGGGSGAGAAGGVRGGVAVVDRDGAVAPAAAAGGGAGSGPGPRRKSSQTAPLSEKTRQTLESLEAAELQQVLTDSKAGYEREVKQLRQQMAVDRSTARTKLTNLKNKYEEEIAQSQSVYAEELKDAELKVI
jgi:hypothetical protein